MNLKRRMAMMETAARKGVSAAGFMLQKAIKVKLNQYNTPRDGETESPAGSPPGKRTGSLGRAVQTDGSGLSSKSHPSMRVGMMPMPYARIHEFGGTIMAKKGMLPIPITNRARKLLREYGTTGAIRSAGVNLAFAKRKDGARFLIEQTKSKNVAVFVLKKSVTMPPRPYIRPAFRETKVKMKAEITKYLAEALK